MIWLNHLREVERNRKIGVAKAAETRKKKEDARKEKNIQEAVLNQDDANCGTCGIGYTEDVEQFWIACGQCQQWYCATYEGLTEEPMDEFYICLNCIYRKSIIYVFITIKHKLFVGESNPDLIPGAYWGDLT